MRAAVTDLATDLGMLLADKVKPGAACDGPGTAQEVWLPCTADLTLGQMLRTLAAEARREMKDKSYQASPVGQVVARYLRAVGFGLSENSLEAYEQVLAWLALFFDDVDEIARFSTPEGQALIEEFIFEKWGRSAEKTKAHRWQVLDQFFRWCVDNDLAPSNPMRGIKRPKAPRNRRERRAYDQDRVRALIDAHTIRSSSSRTTRSRCYSAGCPGDSTRSMRARHARPTAFRPA